MTVARRGRRAVAAGAALVLAVFGLTLVPWTIRNEQVAHRFLPLGSDTGETLFESALQWTGALSPRYTVADQNRLRSLEAPIIADAKRIQAKPSTVPLSVRLEVGVEDALQRAAGKVASHLTVKQVLKRLPAMIAYLWSVSDFPPPDGYQLWHRLAQLQYALLFVLLLVGVVVIIRQPRNRWPFWPIAIYPLYLTALHLVFHVEARFSLPPRPALLIVSSIGLLSGLDRAKSARIRARRGLEAGARPRAQAT